MRTDVTPSSAVVLRPVVPVVFSSSKLPSDAGRDDMNVDFVFSRRQEAEVFFNFSFAPAVGVAEIEIPVVVRSVSKAERNSRAVHFRCSRRGGFPRNGRGMPADPASQKPLFCQFILSAEMKAEVIVPIKLLTVFKQSADFGRHLFGRRIVIPVGVSQNPQSVVRFKLQTKSESSRKVDRSRHIVLAEWQTQQFKPG